MKFSIVILTYGSEKTIAETLNSLLTLKGLENVQLIISDDCSVDSTMAIVQKWVDEFKHLFAECIVRVERTNQGVSVNHTNAFMLANAEYGLYLGGDDLIRNPDFLTELEILIGAHPDVKLARTDVKEYYPADQHTVAYRDEYEFLFAFSAATQFRLLGSIGYCFRSGPGFLIHIPTLRKLGYFGTYNRSFEDYQLALRFTRSSHRILDFPVPGILWRRHAGQTSSINGRMDQGLRQVRRIEIHPYLYRFNIAEYLLFYFKGGIFLKLLYRYRDYFKRRAQKRTRLYTTKGNTE